MVVGGVFAVAAFVMAGFVQLAVDVRICALIVRVQVRLQTTITRTPHVILLVHFAELSSYS